MEAFAKAVEALSATGVHAIAYAGDIDRAGYHQITQICDSDKTHREAILVLATRGGNPHAAFRIARCLGARYDKWSVFIPGLCKSAGTLVCIGASEIIVNDTGELGPLDIQQRKPNEVGEMASGLDMLVSLGYLQTGAFQGFIEYLASLRGIQLSTSLAADIATKLSIGLYGKIFEQIDPIKLGETNRSMDIAFEYGHRLDEKAKNLQGKDALRKLVTKYPSHSFVIDRKEVRSLFKRVRAPTANESSLLLTFTSDEAADQRLTFSLLDVAKEYRKNAKHGDQAPTVAPPQPGPISDGEGTGNGGGDPKQPSGERAAPPPPVGASPSSAGKPTG